MNEALIISSIGFAAILFLAFLRLPLALSMGLVDIMVATPEDIEVEVMKEAKKWSAPGRAPTKALVRKEFVEWFLSDEAADINSFIQLVGNDRTQTAIGAYLQALANKRKK